MKDRKASLFRRVSAWAMLADQATLDSYIRVLHERMDTVREAGWRALRLAFIGIAAFELILVAAVGEVAIGPIAVTDFKLIGIALPGLIAYLLTSGMLAGHVLAMLQVSDSACIRARYESEFLLGIDFPLRSPWSLQEWHLSMWGQPADPRLERAHGWIRRMYLQAAGLALLLYSPLAVVRAGSAFGWGNPALWASALLSVIGVLRVLLVAPHGRGVWALDENIPPAAHLMSSEQIADWQKTYVTPPTRGGATRAEDA